MPASLIDSSTALVLIDLQQGIVNAPLEPHSSAVVLANAVRLAARFREAKLPVVLVRVSFSPDGADALKPPTDAPAPGPRPAGWDELVPEIGPREGDMVITKRQWNAFYGTELDLQLRRRGVRRIVLGGVVTHIGVDSTARAAAERGYELVFAEDAMAAQSGEAHAFPVKHVFPRIGLVRSTAQIVA